MAGQSSAVASGKGSPKPRLQRTNPDAKPTTDLTDAVRSLAKAQAEQELPGRALEIAEVVIGYPYSMGKQNPNRYAIRVRNLWLSSRALNPRSGHPPPLGFIVNTHSYLNPCLKREGRPDVAFLTFRRGKGSVSEACQRAQIGEDTVANAQDGAMDNDADYLRDSFTYADELSPGESWRGSSSCATAPALPTMWPTSTTSPGA